MRKSIFKRELFEIKQKINNDAVFSLIEDKIFEQTHTDRGDKQYFVLDSIQTIDNLKNKLYDVIKGKSKDELIDEIVDILEITDDLKIPSSLKEEILNENVVLFIGAGVSKSLGYPTWYELANKAIEYLSKKGKINNFEENSLYKIKDPKEVLTIFDKLCPRKDDCGKGFYSELFDLKKKDNDYTKTNLYEYITRKEFGWKYITTNIDKELTNALALNKIKLNEQLNTNITGAETQPSLDVIKKEFEETIATCLDDMDINKNIIYLHGILNDLKNTIFTTKDYLNNYFKEGSGLQIFLKEIFKNHTVLFIGYGLSEFSILESIVNSNTDSHKKHFSLYPTFHNESSTLKLKQKAFSELNIELIPYYLDFNGHRRLNEVIKSWHNEIKEERGKDFIDRRNYIDNII